MDRGRRFSGTLATWLNRVVDAGFMIERVAEPPPDEATHERFPSLYSYAIMPWFLQVRARYPVVSSQR
jgi:hypothetical protein